jgi:hypothetical protein
LNARGMAMAIDLAPIVVPAIFAFLGAAGGTTIAHLFQSERETKQDQRQLRNAARDRLQPEFNQLQSGMTAISTIFLLSQVGFGQTPEQEQEIYQTCMDQLRTSLQVNERLRVEPEARAVSESYKATFDAFQRFQTLRQIQKENPGTVTVEQLDKEKYSSVQKMLECEETIRALLARWSQPI